MSIFKRKKHVEESEKTKIRRRIRNKKNVLSDMEKSDGSIAVFSKIELLPEFISARNILIYWSLPDELPTHSYILKWSKNKQILLPMVKGEQLLIKPFSSVNELRKSDMGIWEPEAQREYLKQIDLVIVPGVAFDRKRNRLGRGKGYYDRYFNNKKVTKIGVCYDFQLLENIPADSYDIKMDKVITPNYNIV
ncbi:MAG: 5-formyltetrahydrofolate cyclo-ligase [Porphyromonadaceae bacterium CG2_30_38_12]|nr:MAG: 5-formyltetrahydrofolate cyclo-ligase [Porphyromonadaceae bacterium CG2_30_38_12]